MYSPAKQKAIFIDKDGTLIRDIPFNVDPGRISLMPGVVEGLRFLKNAGFMLFIISNQSGVAKQYFKEPELDAVWEKIRLMLEKEGIILDGHYYCPHFPGLQPSVYNRICDCRKPKPGMILKACSEHGIDANESWMIGDILDDVEAGNRAGCRSILVPGDNTGQFSPSNLRTPQYIAASVNDAASYILQSQLYGQRSKYLLGDY